MKRVRFLLVVPFALALAMAVMTGGSAGATVEGNSTITVHHRLCPTDRAIDDVFEDCHDGLVGQSFEFTIDSSDGEEVFATDAATSNGSVSVPAGVVELWGGVPGEFATTFVYCSQDQVALELTETAFGVSFVAPEGEVVCDWYNTPVDLSGGSDDDDDGDDDEDDEPVTQLPNTGVGPAGGASGTALIAVMTAIGVIGAASVMTQRSQN